MMTLRVILFALVLAATSCQKCIHYTISPDEISFVAGSVGGVFEDGDSITKFERFDLFLALERFSTIESSGSDCEIVDQSWVTIQNVKLTASSDIMFDVLETAGSNLTEYFLASIVANATFPLVTVGGSTRFSEEFQMAIWLPEVLREPFQGTFTIRVDLSDGTVLEATSQEFTLF